MSEDRDPATFLESYEQDLDRQDAERRAEPGPDHDPGELDDTFIPRFPR